MSNLKWQGDYVIGTYLTYVRIGVSPTGKTQVWEVRGKMGAGGFIKWWAPWRQYAFMPDGDTIWAGRCLTETDEFCKELTKEDKERLKAKQGGYGMRRNETKRLSKENKRLADMAYARLPPEDKRELK